MLQEGFSFTGVSNAGFSADPAAFNLTLGGRYRFSVAGTFNSNTVSLQQLAADGTTYVDLKEHDYNGTAFAEVVTGSVASAGSFEYSLPPGTYRIHLGGAGMTIWANIARCPLA